MEVTQQPTKKSKLTWYILIAMVLGIIVGYLVHNNYPPESRKVFADNAKLLTTIFLRMVQMIIAPIVFATLVVGIAKLGDMKTVGRVGGKAMLWFITASLISLGLGLILVNIFEPGVGANISNTDMAAVSDLMEKSKGFSLAKFVEHVVPRSVVEAMATNEILQLVVFSVFFGIALTAIGKKGEPIINALDSLAHVVLKMVTYVMYLAPLGVFGAMAAAISKNGLGILVTFGKYIGEFYFGLAILWGILLTVGYLILKNRLPVLLRRISSPMSIAFSTQVAKPFIQNWSKKWNALAVIIKL